MLACQMVVKQFLDPGNYSFNFSGMINPTFMFIVDLVDGSFVLCAVC